MSAFPLPAFGHSTPLRVPWSVGLRVSRPLENYPRILYLFTRSDLKTIVLPVTFFAYLASPSTTPDRMLFAMLWTWLHLLQFCVSNQSMDPEEDSSNKPWRPIPSSLISVDNARNLRWMLLPLCISVSVRLEAYWQGMSLALAFLAHNEFGLHSHLFMRNICNAWGYASFNAGAFAIASGQSTVTTRTMISFAINALIIISTIYAQDFRDEVGDKRMGRQTIPILWPKGSRIGIFMALAAWSICLSWACGLCSFFSVPFCAWAMFVGLRFFWKRTAEADQRSYRYYNIWLAAAQVVHVPVIAAALSHL
ncbi:UbiA prenyltransferase family-domain-containing protein [Lactarius akahatsu]|uniref:UbiA prenyltransferase family-domain-containing protein n=1 Tax=Lactarius akahatsu TaxID=416441 RepID=A0AAD4QBF5_9AGAM|nr:UbiA prenyltransferase family-domain-containing protein [Lactarius akahatsu]